MGDGHAKGFFVEDDSKLHPGDLAEPALLECDVGDVSKELYEDLEAALLVSGSLFMVQGEPLAHGGDHCHRLSPIDLEAAPEGPVVLQFECGEAVESGGFY